MEQTTYASRLRYLDASDVDDSVADFDGLGVEGRDNTKLGAIDGFIVDSATGRVYYAVVDSGGWFTSRRFLLPIGHATLESDRKVLRVDLTKDALKRYPEFDENRFRAFSDDDLRAFERRIASACCPNEPLEDVSVSGWQLDRARHYSQPEWWGDRTWTRDRLGPIDSRAYTAAAVSAAAPASARIEPMRSTSDERVTARERDDESPHFEGRAQPGDVLGIETGGERTYVGDTAEDENERRRSAQRSAADEEEPRRHDR